MLLNPVQSSVLEHARFVDEANRGTRVATFLQGSQNYGMEDEFSDVDTKSLVVPSFQDLVLKTKPVSETLVLPNNEHADVKDVQEMMLCWRKQNVNFVEVLFTCYNSVSFKYKWFADALWKHREEIAHYSRWYTLMATCGHMEEKYTKLKRAGIARAEVVAKYGYDPKQLCHLFRLKDFLTKYFKDFSYEECLMPDNLGYLRAVKRGFHTLEEAEEAAEKTYQWMKQFREQTMTQLGTPDRDEKVDKLLDELTVELYRKVMLGEN